MTEGQHCRAPAWIRPTLFAAVFAVAAMVLAPVAGADALGDLLAGQSVQKLVPGAERFGDRVPGKPIVQALKGESVVGYVFLNTDFSDAIGYSGKPIDVLIGLDPKGRITGAKLVRHTEPIVLAGVPEEKIIAFVDGYASLDIVKSVAAMGQTGSEVDIVSGATVTVLVIDDSIRRAALAAARVLGLGGLKATVPQARITKTIDPSSGKVQDWLGLIGDGSVRRLKLTVGDVNGAFEKAGDARATARPERGAPDDVFIELYVASLAVPAVARSLLNETEYETLQKRLKPGQSAFLIMGSGPFSFKGSGYVRGGIFDRIQVVQGEASIRFRDRGHKRLGDVRAEGAPRFREVGLFRTPKTAKFDPAEPWRLQLLVPRAVGALEKAFTSFELSYRLPDKYLIVEAPKAPPPQVPATASQTAASAASAARSDLWQRIWQQKTVQIVTLTIAIGLLTILFFFQNVLVRYPTLTKRVRVGFLLFTLIWIGFYAQAQLSVVNVFVFANALIGGFRWEYFLLEPLIFILWCSVAASLLFWGRGAYCGWLCPFGAFQELLNGFAKMVRIPQLAIPWGLHERLWPLKYLIFLALLGLSIHSLALAETLAEIEPFKTAIVLRFARSWPYVLFAVALLGVGLFVERFFCRYLCPLGAALAIPGRLAMFDWLKRYRNCGDPCHLCAQDCMVQAINPMGDINPNECLHCMHCQVMYFDAQVCPVMILKASKAGKPGGEAVDPDALETAKSLYRRPRRLGRTRTIEAEATE
ncbi:MAG: 4Fe-4S binding protein [Methyloligellaceae bacterium]